MTYKTLKNTLRAKTIVKESTSPQHTFETMRYDVIEDDLNGFGLISKARLLVGKGFCSVLMVEV